MWSNRPALQLVLPPAANTECRWPSCRRDREAGSLYCAPHSEQIADVKADTEAER